MYGVNLIDVLFSFSHFLILSRSFSIELPLSRLYSIFFSSFWMCFHCWCFSAGHACVYSGVHTLEWFYVLNLHFGLIFSLKENFTKIYFVFSCFFDYIRNWIYFYFFSLPTIFWGTENGWSFEAPCEFFNNLQLMRKLFITTFFN